MRAVVGEDAAGRAARGDQDASGRPRCRSRRGPSRSGHDGPRAAGLRVQLEDRAGRDRAHVERLAGAGGDALGLPAVRQRDVAPDGLGDGGRSDGEAQQSRDGKESAHVIRLPLRNVRKRVPVRPRPTLRGVLHHIPSGTRDVLPDEMRELRAITEAMRAVFEDAGLRRGLHAGARVRVRDAPAARAAYRLFDAIGRRAGAALGHDGPDRARGGDALRRRRAAAAPVLHPALVPRRAAPARRGARAAAGRARADRAVAGPTRRWSSCAARWTRRG